MNKTPQKGYDQNQDCVLIIEFTSLVNNVIFNWDMILKYFSFFFSKLHKNETNKEAKKYFCVDKNQLLLRDINVKYLLQFVTLYGRL